MVAVNYPSPRANTCEWLHRRCDRQVTVHVIPPPPASHLCSLVCSMPYKCYFRMVQLMDCF